MPKHGLMVRFHELVEFAQTLGYTKDRAVELLEHFRPEYEVTSREVDPEDIQDQFDCDILRDDYPIEDVMKITRALCEKHGVETFTVVGD